MRTRAAQRLNLLVAYRTEVQEFREVHAHLFPKHGALFVRKRGRLHFLQRGVELLLTIQPRSGVHVHFYDASHFFLCVDDEQFVYL